ncbi:hypothetical protein ES705_33944 [subsurface metagenome]
MSLVNKGHVYGHDGTGFYDVDHIIKQPNSVNMLLQKLAPYARPGQGNITMYEQVISDLNMEIQRIFDWNAEGDKLFSRVMSYLCIPSSAYNHCNVMAKNRFTATPIFKTIRNCQKSIKGL